MEDGLHLQKSLIRCNDHAIIMNLGDILKLLLELYFKPWRSVLVLILELNTHWDIPTEGVCLNLF